MASLRDTVKDYQDELRDGIAWVAFWKQGRSWNAEYFHLDMDDTLYPEDRSRLEEIKSIDPAAVILNGYYCGHLGEDMSLDELTAGVRYHYENSMNDIDGFIGAHDDRLPPEVIEEARAAAHEAGLPFSEKPYSFQLPRNIRMPAVASALFASGRLMVQNVRKKLAPSSVAASSRLLGIAIKPAFSTKMDIAIPADR